MNVERVDTEISEIRDFKEKDESFKEEKVEKISSLKKWPSSNPKFKMNKKKNATKVIIDSQMLDELKDGPGRVDPTWDNMAVYLKKKEKDNKTIVQNYQGSPQRTTDDKLKLLRFLMELRGGEWVKRVNGKYVGGVGLVGLGFVIYRLIVSRR